MRGSARHKGASDEELMEEVRGGSTAAFETLVRRHSKRAVNLAYRFVGDAALAEDIAQEAFLRVWRNRHRYSPTAKFTTFLYRVVANLCISQHRYHKRHPATFINPPPDETTTYFSFPGGLDNPLEKLRQQELAAAVREAIKTLPENQRLAIILLRYEGLSYDEIATVMGTTVAAVKSLLVRARQNLKERLKPYL